MAELKLCLRLWKLRSDTLRPSFPARARDTSSFMPALAITRLNAIESPDFPPPGLLKSSGNKGRDRSFGYQEQVPSIFSNGPMAGAGSVQRQMG